MESKRRRRHFQRTSWSAGLLAAVLVMSAGLRGDGTFTPRAVRIGNQLICTCGCTEPLLTCSTLGCTVKLTMQAELRQRAQLNEPDSLVLQSFVQEYGTQVLANPTTKGFNLLAWVMPWEALGLGMALLLGFLKRWRHAAEAAEAVAEPSPELQSKVQSELKATLEDWER